MRNPLKTFTEKRNKEKRRKTTRVNIALAVIRGVCRFCSITHDPAEFYRHFGKFIALFESRSVRGGTFRTLRMLIDAKMD